jgi:dihydrodipicolinate reductase
VFVTFSKAGNNAMRVGIAGIGGRVGRLLVEEVRAAGMELSGGTTRKVQEGGGGISPVYPILLNWRR